MDKMEQAQLFLRDMREQYIRQKQSEQLANGERWTPINDTEIAHYLGVSLTSWLEWLAGDRKGISTDNIIRIARRWPGILPIFDLDYLPVSADPKLNLIIDNWESLSDETKAQIENAIREDEPIR